MPLPALDLNENRRRFKAATASYNPTLNPPAPETIARGRRGANGAPFAGTPLSSPLVAPGAPGRLSILPPPTTPLTEPSGSSSLTEPTGSSSGPFLTDPTTGQPYGQQGWSPGFQKFGQGIARTASLFAGGSAQPPVAPAPSGAPPATALPSTLVAPTVPLASPNPTDMMAESALGQSNLERLPGPGQGPQGQNYVPGTSAPPGALPRVGETPNIYGLQGISRYDDTSGVPTFTNKGRQGYTELQAMPDTPAGWTSPVGPGAGPQPALSPGQSGGAYAGSGAGPRTVSSVENPKLFAALAQARADAEARGDYGAVERSYQTPEERQATERMGVESRLMQRLSRLPAAQVPAALAILQAGETARRGKPPTLDQIRAARAPGVSNEVLFGQRPPPLAPPPRIYNRPQFDEQGTPTAPMPYTLDAQGNAVPVKFPGTLGQGQTAMQPLPEGHTPETARANALAIAKQTPARLAEINQLLAGYGLPPIAEADLR